MSEEVYIRVVETLPSTVRAYVAPGINSYNVYVNPLYTREEQLDAVYHELKHIENNDCFRECDVNELESDM